MRYAATNGYRGMHRSDSILADEVAVCGACTVVPIHIESTGTIYRNDVINDVFSQLSKWPEVISERVVPLRIETRRHINYEHFK